MMWGFGIQNHERLNHEMEAEIKSCRLFGKNDATGFATPFVIIQSLVARHADDPPLINQQVGKGSAWVYCG